MQTMHKQQLAIELYIYHQRKETYRLQNCTLADTSCRRTYMGLCHAHAGMQTGAGPLMSGPSLQL
jgi:hypothetical protein